MGTAATEQYDRRYSPDETVRVGEDFLAGGSVKRTAFGVLDAGVVVERGFLGAARVVDAFFSRQRIHVGGVEIEIAGERAQLRRFGKSGKRIFRGDLRQLQRGLHHAVETLAGKVAGVGAGGALALEYPHANGS